MKELEDDIEKEREWLKKEFGEGDELIETLSVKQKEQNERNELQRKSERKFIRHSIMKFVMYLLVGITVTIFISFLLFEFLGDLIIFPPIFVAIILFLGRLSLFQGKKIHNKEFCKKCVGRNYPTEDYRQGCELRNYRD